MPSGALIIMSGVIGPMKVDVSRLRAVPGAVETVVLRGALTPVVHGGTEVAFDRPVEARVELRSETGAIHAHVEADVEGRVACDRCLDPFPVRLHLDYREAFVPSEGALPGAGTAGGEGVRQVPMSGKVIDLGEGLRQNVIMALPMKLVCREDCGGLCPRCGRNLNEGDCGCRVEVRDSRLEALRPLLERLETQRDRARE